MSQPFADIVHFKIVFHICFLSSRKYNYNLHVFERMPVQTDKVNVLKFQTTKFLTKWHMQTVQMNQIRVLIKFLD